MFLAVQILLSQHTLSIYNKLRSVKYEVCVFWTKSFIERGKFFVQIANN